MSYAALAHEVKSAGASKAKSSPSALRVNQPGDAYERAADRAADQVVSGKSRRAAWSLSKVGMAAPLQRDCSCGGQCDCKKEKEPTLQREAQGGASPAVAPPVVHDVLTGPGRRMDEGTRSFMESRFGYDFGAVRIFNDDAAASSARAVSAHAYTVGNKIVFNQGRYAPESGSGRRLLAHELAHVVQQQSSPASNTSPLSIGDRDDAPERAAHWAAKACEVGSDLPATTDKAGTLALAGRVRQPSLQRLSYTETKESAYKGLIEGARKANQANLALLRKAAAYLPAKLQGAASTLIDIYDAVNDAVITPAEFAGIGIVVGAGEGIANLVRGLAGLIWGCLRFDFHVFWGFFTNFDAAKQDLREVAGAIMGLPGAVKKLVEDWLNRFEKAPSEQKSLMIGELTGQVIGLIATFAVAAGGAGTASKVVTEVTETAEVPAAAADTATAGTAEAPAAATVPAPRALRLVPPQPTAAADAAETAAQSTAASPAAAARPAFQAIGRGGGSAGGRASAAVAAVDEEGALEVASEAAPAPRPIVQLVRPQPAAAAATGAADAATAPVVAPVEIPAPAAPATGGVVKGVVAATEATAKAAQVSQDAKPDQAVVAARGTSPSPSPYAAPRVAPQTQASPGSKPKTKPPFVLWLPQQKGPHLQRYRSWLGALQSDPNYQRGNPAQLEKWHQALRSAGTDGIPMSVYERGHLLGFTGEGGEKRIRVPNWSRDAINSIEMQVDHIIELQLTPDFMREEFDSIFNWELLDAKSNQASGNLLKNSIAAERAKQVAFDPTAASRILKFDDVKLDGGTPGQRWEPDELRAGEQLDAYERLK